MSDILNGAVFKPGEVFSINDTAGDRTLESGWKAAPGIENGTYTDQPGGGICQVSSTMYNLSLIHISKALSIRSCTWSFTISTVLFAVLPFWWILHETVHVSPSFFRETVPPAGQILPGGRLFWERNCAASVSSSP